jgi:hypothetical protein
MGTIYYDNLDILRATSQTDLPGCDDMTTIWA